MKTNTIAFEKVLQENRNQWFKVATQLSDYFEYMKMDAEGRCYLTDTDCQYGEWESYKHSIEAYLEMCEENDVDPEDEEDEYWMVDESEVEKYL